MEISATAYVDNVQGATRGFHAQIMDAIRNGTELPEEIRDLFDIEIIAVHDGLRGIVHWK